MGKTSETQTAKTLPPLATSEPKGGHLTQADIIWAKPPLTVFLQNGRAGLKNAAGEIVLSPIWGKVEVVDDCVRAENVGTREYWYQGGGSGGTTLRDDDHFYRDGKVGLMKDGKVWFDAAYDEIEAWGNSFDVVYTRIGNTPRYVTESGAPILTRWRHFPNVPDEEREPYYPWEKQHTKILMTMELSDNPADPQTCRLGSRLVRLDRMRRSDIRPFFDSHSEIRKVPSSELERFDSDFTYIYSAYAANACGPKAVEKCLWSFRDMLCYESSWSRLILVSVSPKRQTPLDVSLLFRGFNDIAGWENGDTAEWFPDGRFAAGFDDSLSPDEIRMFMVQYFSDHWPAECEYRLWEAMDSYSSSAIRKAWAAVMEFGADSENFRTPQQQAAFLHEYERLPEPSPIVPPGRSWTSIRQVCQMSKKDGWNPRSFAWNICNKGWGWEDEESVAARRENQVRLLRWSLANGADPNHVSRGNSCLDLVDARIEQLKTSTGDSIDHRMHLLTAFRKILIKAGARHAAEIFAEQGPIYLPLADRRDQDVAVAADRQ